MGQPLAPIAFDIESEGMLRTDEITVVGVRLPIGGRLLLNTGGRSRPDQGSVDDLENYLEDVSGVPVSLSVHKTETELLYGLKDIIQERVRPHERMAVAFNGETWRGGFDLPFIRARCLETGADWPFEGVPYCDLMTVYGKRIHSMVDGEEGPEEVKDLCGLFDSVVGDEHCDPWDDSSEAVKAAYNGDWKPLLAHNLADINRTQELAEIAETVVPMSDFQLKNLGTPSQSM